MRTFSIGTRPLILGTLFFALLATSLPLFAHAQTDQAAKDAVACANSNPACLSFDPAVNPVLKARGYVVNKANSPGGVAKDAGDGNGSCVVYNDPGFGGGIVSGCVKNGVFTIDGTVVSAGAGEMTTTAITSNSLGQTSETPTTNAPIDPGCSLTKPSTLFTNCILDPLAFFVLGISNFILGVVGVLLNWVVVKTVFQFSQLIGNSAGLLATWKILRDIGNLILLFGFVLMGIGTILDIGKLPDKKAIPALIVFAVLLNFSIFAAEAVIDTSNVLTSVLYSQANTDPCSTATCDINNGIAGRIMESTGLSGVFALSGAKDINAASNKLVIIIGLSLFSVIGIVVLLATAIMLAWRAVVLTGIIIISPIGFAGMAIQPLRKYANQWWHALIHQSFFAPILFLFIFVDLKVTESFSAVSNNNGLASALVGVTGSDNMGIIMVFMLITGGLVAALMAAKSFGAAGASFAISTAGKATGRLTFGAGGLVGRQTIGRASTALNRSLQQGSLNKWASSSPFGRLATNITAAGANANYDLRGGKAVGALGKRTGIDFGKPSGAPAKGFAGIEKHDTDARVKQGKGFKMTPEQEAEKKDLDEKSEKRQAQLKSRKELLEGESKSTKSTWKDREKALDAEIAGFETKVAQNAGNTEVNRLEQEITEEKANGQRQSTLGTTSPGALLSQQRVADLEQQRDEYVKAETKLNELRATKTKELGEYKEKIERIQKDVETVGEQTKKSTAEYQEALKKIDPQRRYINTLEKYKVIGGQPNVNAIKILQAGLKKSKGEKAADALKAAIDTGDAKTIGEKTDEMVAAVKEEEAEDKPAT